MNTPTNLAKRNQTSPERVKERPTATPLVDVYENKEGLYLFADVPGTTKDSVNIRLEKGQLTIEAGVAHEEVPGAALAVEWRPADYVRVFAVPDGIDASKIDAQLASGVLRVRLPKAEAVKPRQITVKAG